MSNNTPAKQGAFYDLDQIKQIPILDVARSVLGIECVTRSGKTWCKAHPERTASTLLHEDNNTFHDFGTNQHGDAIELVSYVMDIERKDAIKVLAEAYGIQPKDQRKGLNPNELSMWEYSKIGLYGDQASKNFEFDIERQSIERIYELSQKYSIPMNELRKKYPKTYENILYRKAVPYIRTLRTEYFLEVWSQYQTTRNVGNPGLFFQQDNLAMFDAQIKHLKDAERVFSRAIEGTSIKKRAPREYDPVKDLEQLSKGKIKPVLGPASYDEMKDAAKLAECEVKYRPVSYEQYVLHMMCEADDLLYSAFFDSGRVIIGYLEADQEKFIPYFDKMRTEQAKSATKKENTPSQSKAAATQKKSGAEPER